MDFTEIEAEIVRIHSEYQTAVALEDWPAVAGHATAMFVARSAQLDMVLKNLSKLSAGYVDREDTN